MIFAVYLVLLFTTTAVIAQKQLNEQCSSEHPCNDLPPGQMCHAPPSAAVQGDCSSGLVCVERTNTCKYDQGQVCTRNDECWDDLCVQGKCVLKGSAGAPCKAINDCRGALLCKNNICAGSTTWWPIDPLDRQRFWPRGARKVTTGRS